MSIRALTSILFCCVFVAIVNPAIAHAQEQPQKRALSAGSKVFIEPMGGFETYLRDALDKKKVPLVVVDKKKDADFDITGHSDSQKASKAKKIILGSWHSSENASIQVADLKSGDVVYAYSYHNNDSAHGKKSSAESCAKHLGDEIKKSSPKPAS